MVNDYDLNEKIKTLATKEETETLATKAELKAEQGKILKLQTNDLSLFIGQRCFKNNKAHFYLIS